MRLRRISLAMAGLALAVTSLTACAPSSESNGACGSVRIINVGGGPTASHLPVEPEFESTDAVLANLKQDQVVKTDPRAMWIDDKHRGHLLRAAYFVEDNSEADTSTNDLREMFATMQVVKRSDGLHVWVSQDNWWPATPAPVYNNQVPARDYLKVVRVHVGSPDSSTEAGAKLPDRFIKRIIAQLKDGDKRAYIASTNLWRTDETGYQINTKWPVKSSPGGLETIGIERHGADLHVYTPKGFKAPAIRGDCGSTDDSYFTKVTVHKI